MGRHAAADGAGVDPLVAAALAGRDHDAAGAHREGAAASGGEVGWPAPATPGGGGLGWPGDLDDEDGPARGQQRSTEPVPAPRRGWRRLFGMSPAA